MDRDVDGAALPLNHLHLAIVLDHTDHRVVDMKLIHVVHVARRRGVKRFTEEKQSPGGTKRFGAFDGWRQGLSGTPLRRIRARRLVALGTRPDARPP
jgi:hypothetical protein